MKNESVRSLTRGAMIAAMYVLLTLLLQPISFGAVQFRVAEALTVLPILFPCAVPGLFVGCLIANLLCGGLWYDVVFGSLATLLAAYLTHRLRARPVIAAAMPALINGVVVGPVVYFAYVSGTGGIVLLSTCGTVALGELAVTMLLGLPLVKILRVRLAKARSER